MLSLRGVSSLGFLVSCVFAAPMDWVGTYSDSIYGGNISVCVTEMNGGSTYYGQGLFSYLGYMRGTISGNVWSGNYWVAGGENKRGTFSLTLDTSSPGMHTYAGTFSEMPGYDIAVSGWKGATETPSDLECFRTDASLLGVSANDYFIGHWHGDESGHRHVFVKDGRFHAAYDYEDEGETYYGANTGGLFNSGQVATCQWSESGTYEGLELMVAKDDSSFYSLYWYYTTVSQFEYSTDAFAVEVNHYLGSSNEKKASQYDCLEIPVSSMEETCMEDGDEDEGNGVVRRVVNAALAMNILVFVGLIGLIIRLHMPVVEPMAKQEKADSKL